jgi:hypothetical protein
MRKSRFDNPKFIERRRRALARDPSLRGCYPWCTPEDEAEFYAAIERGVARYGLSFTRPQSPVAPAKPTPAAPEPPQAKARPRAARDKAPKALAADDHSGGR